MVDHNRSDANAKVESNRVGLKLKPVVFVLRVEHAYPPRYHSNRFYVHLNLFARRILRHR